MDLDKLTIGELKNIKNLLNDGCDQGQGPWNIGEKYLIRGVTNYHCGRLVGVWDKEILLDDAAWIPDTGRFANAIEKGEFEEVEPIYGKVIIGRGSISDAVVWRHELKWNLK